MKSRDASRRRLRNALVWACLLAPAAWLVPLLMLYDVGGWIEPLAAGSVMLQFILLATIPDAISAAIFPYNDSD